ncbi:MAG: 16S rRNA (cytosine(967)-C(5))-methyltransferase RsmB [Eubacteriales bacterium]
MNQNDPRQVALSVLHATEKQGGWSEGVLKKSLGGLDPRDRSLATQLCFGVLQNQGLLDFYLGSFSNMPLKRMELMVVLILRLGAYQILCLDKIPSRAAVDSSVNLTKIHAKNKGASGMVNGILRTLDRNLENLPPIPQTDPIEHLSVLYSHPKWLVERFSKELPPEELALFLAHNNSHPPITAMVNTTITTTEELTKTLEEQGVVVEKSDLLEHCVTISRTGNIEQLQSFQEGLFYIQDPASRLAIEGSVRPGMKVLDTCAAPGGKSMAMAIAMQNRGEIISCDLHPHKKKLIQASADRLKLSIIKPEVADAKIHRPEWDKVFDVVLVDAPCSGLGVIAKKPDIRYKDGNSIQNLPKVQQEILQNCSQYVQEGGLLLYSTCTVLTCENQDIVANFLQNNPDFSLESRSLPIGEIDQITLLPHRHNTDGFFIARLRRKQGGTR